MLRLGRVAGRLGAPAPELRLARLAVRQQAAGERPGARAAVGAVVPARQLGQPAVRPKRTVDLGQVGIELGVAEQIARRRELDAGVVVGVQHRAGGERLQLLGAEQQVGEHVVRRRQPAPPRLGARRRIAERALEQIDVERQRLHARHQDSVRRQILGGEDVDVRERLAHRAVDGLDVPGRHLVELRPLAEDAVGREARLHAAEVLAREQVRDAGQPGVRRLADDDVELVLPLREEVAPVADARRDLGVLAAGGGCRWRRSATRGRSPAPARPPRAMRSGTA